MQKLKLEISPWSVVVTVLVLLCFYFVFIIRDIITLFFVVLILTATFRPVVNRWEKKIGRIPSVISLLLIAIGILAFIIYIIVPPLIDQFGQLVNALPDLVNRLKFLQSYHIEIQDSLRSLTSNTSEITGSFVSITSSVFGGIFAFVTAVVMTIYLLLDRDGAKKLITTVVPEKSHEAVVNILKKIEIKVGNWFRGQMMLALIIGFLHYIILTALGVPYALPLALIAGLLEIVPTIGPIIAGVISVAVALTVSPLVALIAAILLIVVQQLENSFLVPKIMEKAVGLSPVVIILAILVGAKLLGLLGALLAVPISGSILVIIQEWPSIRSVLHAEED